MQLTPVSMQRGTPLSGMPSTVIGPGFPTLRVLFSAYFRRRASGCCLTDHLPILLIATVSYEGGKDFRDSVIILS